MTEHLTATQKRKLAKAIRNEYHSHDVTKVYIENHGYNSDEVHAYGRMPNTNEYGRFFVGYTVDLKAYHINK